jgi:hypothetical protein
VTTEHIPDEDRAPARTPIPASPLSDPTPAPTVATLMRALQQSAGNRAARSFVRDGALTGARRQGRALARTPQHIRYDYSEPKTDGGSYGTTAAYDVDLVGIEAILTMKIKLTPRPGVTAQDVTDVQTAAERIWVDMWDSRFILTDRADQSQHFLRVQVQWVSTGAHFNIALHHGQGSMDAANWYVIPDTPVTYAHEMTHKMGMLDEYIDPTAVRRRRAASPGVFTDHSVMGNYLTEGTGDAEVKLRHGQLLADHIGRAFRPRRRFTAGWTGPAMGDRLVHWRKIRDALAAGSAERRRAAAEVTAVEADMLIPQTSAAAGVPYVPTP